MRKILLFFLLLTLVVNMQAQTPKYEVRAVWLTTIGGIDWPHTYANSTSAVQRQKQELTTILDKLQQANINTVLLQARVRATTIFPNSREPWDACLSGKAGVSPGYDALQFAIDECHKRGMQCHAWIVTIPVGKWNNYGCRQLRQKYPKLIVKVGDEGYMHPEMSETGDYLAQFCRDVVRRYDVDGIHLDYIRYSETWKMKVSRSQGRQYITNIVRKIHQAVKAEKPWVMLSCSPIGKYDDLSRYKSGGWNANTTVCQDAQGWLRDGLMDALFPMMYFQGNNFFPFVVNWKEFAYGRIIAPGLAAYMLHPSERNWPLEVMQREMYVIREQGLGQTFFRSKFLTDNTKGLYIFTKDFNKNPALIPPMTWYDKRSPSVPLKTQLQRGMKTDMLTWEQPRDYSGGDYLIYNIYASDDYPVDITDARNLISTRQRSNQLTVQHGRRQLNYAVTAVDRFGNESLPAQTVKPAAPLRKLDFRELIVGKPKKRTKKR